MPESLAGVGGELKPAWNPDVITCVCGGFGEEAWWFDGPHERKWEVSPEKGLPYIHDKLRPGRASLGVPSPAEDHDSNHGPGKPHDLIGKAGDRGDIRNAHH